MRARIVKIIDLVVVAVMVGFSFLAGLSYTEQAVVPDPAAQPALYQDAATGTNSEGFTVWKG